MAYYIQITIGSWQTNFNWSPPPTPDYWRIVNYTNEGIPTPFPAGVVSEFAVTTSKRRELPDFVVVNAAMCVSPRLREHIELIEPGRNQFIPFTPLRKDRTPYEGNDGQTVRYHMLHVTELIDAVDLARSAESKVLKAPRYNVHPESDKLVLRRSVIRDRHVWSGRLQLAGRVFVSDTLGDWIIANRMKGMEITKVEESDD